ncbi:aurora kinase A interacting protein 1, isoform CRA_b [Rattus norvegicus]|uniref:Aurora kinase A interacting protein 1, isoform CRA_b n=1 Tax=Rattus norvegicus TaxID=10116 RepID=A6IUT2_RAT|nr:aurora kinase A interacting protein 1, isoform CRA_b [Rattus norvegicus]
MFLARLTSQLVRSVVPWAGFSRSWPGSGVIGSHAFRPLYSLQPASPSRAASLPARGRRKPNRETGKSGMPLQCSAKMC